MALRHLKKQFKYRPEDRIRLLKAVINAGPALFGPKENAWRDIALEFAKGIDRVDGPSGKALRGRVNAELDDYVLKRLQLASNPGTPRNNDPVHGMLECLGLRRGDLYFGSGGQIFVRKREPKIPAVRAPVQVPSLVPTLLESANSIIVNLNRQKNEDNNTQNNKILKSAIQDYKNQVAKNNDLLMNAIQKCKTQAATNDEIRLAKSGNTEVTSIQEPGDLQVASLKEDITRVNVPDIEILQPKVNNSTVERKFEVPKEKMQTDEVFLTKAHISKVESSSGIPEGVAHDGREIKESISFKKLLDALFVTRTSFLRTFVELYRVEILLREWTHQRAKAMMGTTTKSFRVDHRLPLRSGKSQEDK
ncbi:hypothetical protein BGZ83_002265 [Gryganskiella cystojenkinii]|nr:hypothetical protein BGZ83_002265 [Gryganskiella cystojenkinii]